LPDKVRGAVLQRTRQLLEVRRAMEKLRARETAPEKTARFAGIELGDLKREGHSLDQATGSSSDGGGGGGGADCRDTRSDGGSVMGPLRPNPPKRARSNCSQSTVASFASTAASLALEQTLPVESSRSSRPQLRRQKSSGASDGKASLSVPSDGSAMTFITPALAELLGIKLSDGDEEGTGVVDGDAQSASGPTRRRLSSTISPSKAQATSGGAKGVDAAAGPSGQLKKVKLSMSDLKMVEAVMYASVNESALCALILSMGWDADQMAQLRPERAPSLEEPSARARNNRIPHLRLHELQRNGGAISPTQLPEISPDAKYSAHELKAFQATLRAETAATAAQEARWLEAEAAARV